MSLPTKATLRPSKSQHKIFAITDVGKHDKLDDMWSTSSPSFDSASLPSHS